MGFYKQLAIMLSDDHYYNDRLTRQQNINRFTLELLGLPDPDASLEAMADALGGEVSGRNWVKAPSPGAPADDRSLVVRINPEKPWDFFVYAESCGLSKAKAHVQSKLDLVPAVPVDHSVRIRQALKIWNETAPAEGTVAEAYLRERAITLPIPASIRFHQSLYHGASQRCWQAMVAKVTTADGEFQAVHRTYLNGARKALVDPVKMMLGPCRGNAIQLNSRLTAAPGPLYIGEGIETCLSVMQGRNCLTWVAGSTSGLKTACLPNEEREIVIIADAGDEGEKAAQAAADRWQVDGRRVMIARPPAGFDDFNEVLMDKSTMRGTRKHD